MLSIVMVVYIVFYVLWCSALYIAAWLIPDGDSPPDEPWELPVDIVLMSVGLLGMLFLVLDVQSSALKTIWIPVSLCLVLAQIGLNIRARIRSVENDEDRWAVKFTDVMLAIVLMPSLGMNLVFAFAG